MDKKIILEESDEAATYRTDIKGWVSADGIYCGDGPAGERQARYVGSTHRKCKTCGELVEKIGYCRRCRDDRIAKKYQLAPRMKWDGETPLVICDDDHYFFSAEELDDYCEENECLPAELRLMICVPQFARTICSDIWEDVLPEDTDVPVELETAIETFNASVKAYGKPLSWTQGTCAAEL